MKRDGKLESLWQHGTPAYTPANTLQRNTVYDVIIAGGGITGITTGLLLQKAGKKCVIVEANNICFGTTGGTTAHLNNFFDTPYSQMDKNFSDGAGKKVANAAKEAIGLIRQNIKEYGINCGFEEADAFVFSQDEKQTKELQDMHDGCLTAGVRALYSREVPIPVTFNKAVVIPGQAKFNPVDYVYALAKAFEDAGGVIVQQCRVSNVEENEVVDVETSTGKLQGRQFIYATHIPPGINILHMRCAPYRSYAMAVRLAEGSYPKDLIYDTNDPYHYYRTQKVHGMDYLIIGGEDHKTAHATNTEECFNKLEAHIKSLFNIEEVSYKWSSQYFEPADGLPYIGHLPGAHGNVFVATGFGGNGMIYSNVAAMVLRDILAGKEDELIKLFDPSRIKPIAGFTNFVKENADVAKKLVSGWFSKEKLEEISALAKGEGKVVKYEGESIALYKDNKGKLHAVSPACTHMGCSVAWNNAEQSWDCPCHGARYTPDGKVITGPAGRDLKPVEIQELVATHEGKK